MVTIPLLSSRLKCTWYLALSDMPFVDQTGVFENLSVFSVSTLSRRKPGERTVRV
jgi:hypothetical protein